MNIMKISKNILTAAALIITAAGLSSCYVRISKEQKAMFKNDLEYIDSQMDKDTVTFEVGEFESFSQERSLDNITFIQTDGEYKVEIAAYSQFVDSVFVHNNDGTLRIGVNGEKSTLGPISAWVYAPSIKAISTIGSGEVVLRDYSGDSLVITATGSGDIFASNMDLSGLLMVNVVGSGDQHFEYIKAGELMITKAGSADSDYSVINVGQLSVTAAGSGDTQISGKAESYELSKKGSGEIDTSQLKVKDISDKN